MDSGENKTESLPTSAIRPSVWPAFVAFGVALVAALLAQTVLYGAALAIRAIGGAADPFSEAQLEAVGSSPVLMVVSLAVAETLFASVAVAGAAFSRGGVRSALGLVRPRGGAAGVVLAALGCLAVSQVLDAIVALLQLQGVGSLGNFARAVQSMGPAQRAASGAVIALGAGFGEELLFRGYIQRRLRAGWGAARAVVVAAALFGLVHLDPVHSPVAMGLGLYLGWVAVATESLWPAIIAHVLNNAVAVATVELQLPGGWPAAAVGAASALLAAACVWLLRKRCP